MNPTLIIASNDASLRDAYAMYLSERGFDVRTVSSGPECLDLLQATDPVALVLDLNLPAGGSEDIVSWLREERGELAVPVVLLAPEGVVLNVTGEFEEPIVKVLEQPFAPVDLLDSVWEAVESRKPEFREPVSQEPARRTAGPAYLSSSEGCQVLELEAPPRLESAEDVHLAERIERALHSTSYHSLYNVEVKVREQHVILKGRVMSYYLKQFAQAIALAVPGTRQVRNKLHVVRSKRD